MTAVEAWPTTLVDTNSDELVAWRDDAVPVNGAFECCEVRIDALTIDEALDRLQWLARRRVGAAFHLCNAYTLSLARRDPDFAALLNRGDVNLPDGTPVAWIGRKLGFDHLDRATRGPDFMVEAIKAGRSWGMKHYLYGGSPEVVADLRRHLEEIAPGVEIVGIESPPFRDPTPAELARFIRNVQRSGAHAVWVGLGTPKQDIFVDRMRDRLPATLIPVGAAFDFIAGAKREAPKWMQHSGIEWLFRFATEPRRLAKRYVVGNSVFLAGAARGNRVIQPSDG